MATEEQKTIRTLRQYEEQLDSMVVERVTGDLIKPLIDVLNPVALRKTLQELHTRQDASNYLRRFFDSAGEEDKPVKTVAEWFKACVTVLSFALMNMTKPEDVVLCQEEMVCALRVFVRTHNLVVTPQEQEVLESQARTLVTAVKEDTLVIHKCVNRSAEELLDALRRLKEVIQRVPALSVMLQSAINSDDANASS